MVLDSSQSEVEDHHEMPVKLGDEVQWAEGQTYEDGGKNCGHSDVE